MTARWQYIHNTGKSAGSTGLLAKIEMGKGKIQAAF